MRYTLLLVIALLGQSANAQSQNDEDGDETESGIVVTARKLDAARDAIDPSTGASRFSFDRAQLDSQPGGTDRNLKGVLLQAPGVSQDSDGDGDVHIRNEHGNIQYRLNGVTVPQGFAGFGALVDPRVASSVEVITGALPAQYGFRTAGIVNMKTRTDSFDFDGDVGIYGGGNGTVMPSATLRDSVGRLNYFLSGSYTQNNLGISNPTPAPAAVHDRTEQWRGFGYLSYILDDSSRITAFGGSSIGKFQIPNSPGLSPSFNYRGRTAFDSARIDQNQRQTSHFAVLAWQYSGERLDVQLAPFFRSARAHYTPDPQGAQLMFNGVDTDLAQTSRAFGVQGDASLKLGENHRLRTGLFYQRERTRSDSVTRVFGLTAAGTQASDTPTSVALDQRQRGSALGLYLQDEWSITDRLTFNYGIRFDQSNAQLHESQFSPRAGLVWKPSEATTLHIGYARYFTPPPLELVTSGTLDAFDGTTGEAEVKTFDPVRSEREHSYDIGAQHMLTQQLSAAIDIYFKQKRNLLDEEHFGATLIQSPFNYARSKGWGAEFNLTYESRSAEFYLNFARGQQKAKDIVSNQFFFDAAELGYIAGNYIYTDHSQKWTISGGSALNFHDGIGKLQLAADFVYGDGLRAGDPNGVAPNGGKQKSYVQVNLGIAQVIGDSEERNFTLRLDVTNLFDKIYLIHDGSGVGAGQPEWGPRRAIFIGLRKAF